MARQHAAMFVLVVAFPWAAPALADLPPATFIIESTLNAPFGPVVNHWTAGSFDDFFVAGSALETARLASPEVTAVSASSIQTDLITADSMIWYSLSVRGPESGAPVKVKSDYRLNVSGLDTWWGGAEFLVNAPVTGAFVVGNDLESWAGAAVPDQAAAGTLEFDAAVGSIYTVVIRAYASTAGCDYLTTCGSEANALADPYFYVDPLTPNSASYSLAFSEGVENVPLTSVPEPPAIWLYLSSVALLGLGSTARKQ